MISCKIEQWFGAFFCYYDIVPANYDQSGGGIRLSEDRITDGISNSKPRNCNTELASQGESVVGW